MKEHWLDKLIGRLSPIWRALWVKNRENVESGWNILFIAVREVWQEALLLDLNHLLFLYLEIFRQERPEANGSMANIKVPHYKQETS